MYIRMNMDEIRESIVQMKRVNVGLRDQLQQIDLILMETREVSAGELEKAFQERFQEVRVQYEKIVEFHEGLIKELESMMKDYQELDEQLENKQRF